MAAAIAALPPEGDHRRCKRPAAVKAKTDNDTSSRRRASCVSRNYQCKAGFAPRDVELNLPEEGEISTAMERRILNLGVTDTFESVAER